MELSKLLEFARQNGASDLHVCAGAVPVLRIDGTLQKLNLAPLSDEEVDALIDSVLSDGQKEILANDLEIDFSAELVLGERYRVNVYNQLRGKGAAFRVIKSSVPSFEDLGLPDILKEISLKDRGLILVTGPTGCGKSTTLAAIIDYLNEKCAKHVISIEDPIEYIHQNKQCLINQREVGQHTHEFRNALRSAMREDPDIIMVGEMRDMETVSLALTAAETGHLVFSTLHTSSAVKTVDRIIDIFPADSKDQIRTMLSESLVGVISQRLLPKSSGKGRALAMEIMIANTAVKNLIREDKVFQIPNIMQSNVDGGMCTMDASLASLVQKGDISRDDARTIAAEPENF